MSQRNILVVDDEKEFLESVKDILVDKGYTVHEAHCGEEALEKISRQNFDLVLMDVKMPGINGVETFKEIKRMKASTQVVMMTGSSLEHELREALQEGAYTVLYKPFDIDVLVRTIEEALMQPCLLVVDDRIEELETLRDILIEKDYRVYTAKNGKEALEMVERGCAFDIIFIDMKMPGMNGIETFEKIKEINKKIAIVLMSAYSMDEHIELAIREGILAYVYKPFDINKLVELVEEFKNTNKVCAQEEL